MTWYRDYQEIMAGCWAYYPNTLLDSIGGYHVTNQGGVQIATDRFGGVNKAYYFSGAVTVNALLPVTIASIVASNTNNTILVWAKYNSGSYDYFLSKPRLTGGVYYDWYITSVGVRMSPGGVDKPLAFSTTPVATNWNLLGFTHDRSTLTAYTNGVYAGSIAASGAITNSDTGDNIYKYPCVAAWDNNSTVSAANNSNVSIGEIWFFNRVLTPIEIKTLYQITNLRYLSPNVYGSRGIE